MEHTEAYYRNKTYRTWVNIAANLFLFLLGLGFYWLFVKTQIPYLLFGTGWFMKAAVTRTKEDTTEQCCQIVEEYHQACLERAMSIVVGEDDRTEQVYWRVDGAADALMIVLQKMQNLRFKS